MNEQIVIFTPVLNKTGFMEKCRKVYTLGETVFDLLFTNMQPIKGVPGGATLNSSITLGRLGVPVFFVSEFGEDLAGNFIADFLKKNLVDTRYVYRYADGATTLAIASLDETRNATYNFYKIQPAEHLQISPPPIEKDDIVLYGSFFSISPVLRDKVSEILQSARSRGALLVYDPNFRKAHEKEMEVLRPMIFENMQWAHIIRGSDEDFFNILKTRSPEETWEKLPHRDNCLVYTASKEVVTWINKTTRGSAPSKNLVPLSTIGAGDTFNAGLVYSLLQQNITPENLEKITSQQWKELVLTGIELASEVCLSYDNYISENFAHSWRNRSPED